MRPYLEVLARLDAGEAGLTEDLSDDEIRDAHNREAREIVALALGVPLPTVPAWVEVDPRLDNVQRLTLAALLERADTRGVVAMTARDVAGRLHDHAASPIYAAALDRLLALRVIARVGEAAWCARRRP